MNVCPECNRTMGKRNYELFIAGLCSSCAGKYITKQDQRIEELEEALVRIDNWAKAYPLDIFLKPDLKKAAKVLNAAGMTLDAITGDAMRHVLNGVKDITKQALKGK